MVRQILAISLACFVVTLAVTLWLANDDRADRGRNQEPRSALGGPVEFRVTKTDLPYEQDVWTSFLLSDSRPGSEKPPGVATFPGAGQAYVSPAVMSAIRRDPSVASRVPGRIVGVLGDEGLQSPDQFVVYAGVSGDLNSRGVKAGGWGSPADTTARPFIPRGPLVGILFTLLGLPALLLLRATTALSSEARTREVAALHLLGVSSRSLAIAEATSAALCALAGGVVGALVAVGTALALSETTVLGFSWFNLQPSVVLPPTFLVVMVAMVLIAVSKYVVIRRSLQHVLVAREGGPALRSALWLAPLAVGASLLLGMVVPFLVAGQQIAGASDYYVFLTGTFLATLGAFAALPLLLRGAGRLLLLGNPGLSRRLTSRRLWWDSDTIARSVIGLLIVMITGVLGAAAIADIEALSPERAQGNQYTVNPTVSDRGFQAIGVAAPLKALRVGGGRTATWVGRCADLTTLVSETSLGLGQRFAEGCQPGSRFKVADVSRGGAFAVPGISQSQVGQSWIIATDPGDYEGSLEQAELVVYPGPENAQVDDYFTGLSAADPAAVVTNTGTTSFEPAIPNTKRLFLVCGIFGALIAAALLLLAAFDSAARRRNHALRLHVIGDDGRLSRKIQVLTFGTGVLILLIVATSVAWLAGMSYDIVGGTGTNPGVLGIAVTVAGAASAALTMGLYWLAGRRSGALEVTSALQRE